MVCGAGLSFAFLDTVAKTLVTAGMAPLFVAWARFTVHVVLVLLLFRAWSNRQMFRTHNLPAQILRGVFLFTTTFLNFFALKTLQLAEANSFFFFAPMVITALAGPLLGEWAGWRRWAAILAGFIGILVIARPGVAAFEFGHVLAAGATLSYAIYVIMTRKMGATETPESLIFYSALTPVVLLLPVVPSTASLPQDAWQWLLLLSMGFFGGFGHWLLIRSYKIATTTALAPYPYLQMVWMIIMGWLVFGQLPDGWTLLGAGIVVAAGLYIVQREQRLRLASRTVPNTEDQELAKRL
ncbi:MAG: DMT family transporter [Rhizobiaceae bacterium]